MILLWFFRCFRNSTGWVFILTNFELLLHVTVFNILTIFGNYIPEFSGLFFGKAFFTLVLLRLSTTYSTEQFRLFLYSIFDFEGSWCLEKHWFIRKARNICAFLSFLLWIRTRLRGLHEPLELSFAASWLYSVSGYVIKLLNAVVKRLQRQMWHKFAARSKRKCRFIIALMEPDATFEFF